VGQALQAILPSSGYGPAEDRLQRWSWEMSLTARTVAGHEVRVGVEGDGHPFYLTTARCVGEVGLLLAEPGATPDRAGCLTPAAALGTAALDRLERAGLRFTVD
jgi:short subunit dehydrogenase-like uncharacterized protein